MDCQAVRHSVAASCVQPSVMLSEQQVVDQVVKPLDQLPYQKLP